MAIKRRLSGYSGMRIDWPHIRSIESSVSNDFDSMLRGLMTGLNRPYLIRGFRMKIPPGVSDAQSLQIEVADSVVLHSSATESGTILSVPPGTTDETLDSNNNRIIGSFQNGVVNYISLDYRRTTDTTTTDQTAGWSASQKLEFQRSVPIGKILDYKFIITTSGFSTNLPLYTVKTTSTGSVEYITKCSTNFFRLGSGGPNPNPANLFEFGNIVNPETGTRREWIDSTSSSGNPVTVVPGDIATAFDLGDFSIKNFKDWMDAVMTRIREITGSSYWYTDGNMPVDAITLKNLWWDTIGSALTGVGSLSYNLILESGSPQIGYWQSFGTDSSILPGDSYVEGFTSRTKATLSRFNKNQLVINSLTSAAFAYGETLWNRRLFRPIANEYNLTDFENGDYTWGVLNKQPTVAGSTVNVSSWFYTNTESDSGDGLSYSTISITTASAHGFTAGDFVKISGLVLSGSTSDTKFWPGSSGAPAVAQIKKITSTTSFEYVVPYPQNGTPIASSGTVQLAGTNCHPYVPKFEITEWSYVGTAVTVVAENNNFVSPVALSGSIISGSYNITGLSSTDDIKINMEVSGTGIQSGSVVTKILSSSSVEISETATATNASASLSFKDRIWVIGLSAVTDAPNGVWTVDSVGPGQDEVNFTATLAPTGTATLSSGSHVKPDVHTIRALKVTGSTTDQFNVTDLTAYCVDETKIQYLIGPSGLPELQDVTGGLIFDGVVAESTVLDPVQVLQISNTDANEISVTTDGEHGYTTTAGPITFTIYGNSTDSVYIRTYADVSLEYVDDYNFRITGSRVPFAGPPSAEPTYINSGLSDPTFVRYQDNPYPGPVAWDADMYVKGIIGDKYFRIPLEAVAYTTAEDEDGSPLANQFNTNGQTGTVYLQDGEVAYIKFDRDEYVSFEAIWSTTGGGGSFISATAPLDKDGNYLVAGDFVKFEDEDETKWIRIAGTTGTEITANSFAVVSDNGQSPNSTQRPAKSGKLVYCKGSYNKIYVRKHYLVEPSANIYWLAFRRDNQSNTSKVYLKGLELEAGEVRQVEDNQSTNMLQYIGALNEGSVNPNYSVSDTTGDYQYVQQMEVSYVDTKTRMITFSESTVRGIQKGDRIRYASGSTFYYYNVKQPISSRSAIVVEDVSTLPLSGTVDFYTENKNILDQDNLTKALRKEDRELGEIQTAYNRPVYDESVYIQQMNLSGAGIILSGSYIYIGSQNNPDALAWVLHGTTSQLETIEGVNTLPGGHVTVGPNSILVHFIGNSTEANRNFDHGTAVYQNGSLTGFTVDNLGDAAFLAPSIYGDSSGGGVEIVLPPNKRTQIRGEDYVVWGAHSTYKATSNPETTGEDLLVIVNDSIREAGIDYTETFGGPKAKIQFIRTLPPNSRIRFRTLATFGSVLASKSSDISLQLAYNGGATIIEAAGVPVEITAYNVLGGETSLINRGSILMNGGSSAAGGIFNENTDKSFVIGNENDKPKEIWAGTEGIKTHDSHPGSAVVRKTAAQTVTGPSATIITGSEVTIPDLTTFRIKVSATARRSDASFGAASFTMEGTFYRDDSLAVTGPQAAGSPISVINGADGSGVAYAIAFGIFGNDVVTAVYGDVGNTVQWVLSIEYQGVSTGS
jgi:hypothetical protein